MEDPVKKKTPSKKRKKEKQIVSSSVESSPSSALQKQRHSLDEKVRPSRLEQLNRNISQSLPQSPKSSKVKNAPNRTSSLKVEQFKSLLLKVKEKNDLVAKIEEDEKRIANEMQTLKQQFNSIISTKSEKIQSFSFGFGEQMNARLKRVKLARTTPNQIIDVVEMFHGKENADLVYMEMKRLHEAKHSGKFVTKIYERASNKLKRKKHIEL